MPGNGPVTEQATPYIRLLLGNKKHGVGYFCWPEVSRQSAKMGLSWISRELQFGVCSHGGPHASPQMAREGGLFYRGEKKARRARVNKGSIWGVESSKYSGFSLADFWQFLIGWVVAEQEEEVFLLPFVLCYYHRVWKLLFLASQSYYSRGFKWLICTVPMLLDYFKTKE